MSARAPRVLVTRAAEDAPTLAHALSEASLTAVVVPSIQRVYNIEPVAELARRAGDADLLVVTSAAVADVMGVAAPSAWRSCEVAAVGGATQRRLEDLGWPVHHVPARATAADLVDLLGEEVAGLQIAWPRADLADPTTADLFRERGAVVHDCIAYHNRAPADFPDLLAASLPVDCTTLMSGSAARRVAEQLPEDQRWRLGRIVVIGPSTRTVCEEVGLAVHAMARPHSVAGLVRAVSGLFAGLR